MKYSVCSPRWVYGGLLLGAGLPLVAAYISQYQFGLHPCVLCVYQRIVYGVALAFGLGGWLLSHRNKKVTVAVLWLCMLTFLAGAGIAFFHVGVEQKWWTGTDKCSSEGIAASINDLLQQLYAAPKARCDEPQWQFILTMAGWNVLYSLGLAGLCGYGAWRCRTSRGV